MQKLNMYEIEGTEFPAGRRTRVMFGPTGQLRGEAFCQGFVTIYPGGSVPSHEHETVETYTILSGVGEMTVGDETQPVKEGDAVFIPRMQPHTLKNTGSENMKMMFCYAPDVVVDHWAQEQAGEL